MSYWTQISLIGSKMERLLVWYRNANKAASSRDRHAALRMVASRFDEVVSDDRFLRLSVAEVVPLLSCSNLGTSGYVRGAPLWWHCFYGPFLFLSNMSA